MHKDHAKEQYFFTEGTRRRLARVAQAHQGMPLFLCCPTVGVTYTEMFKEPSISLDSDPRFKGGWGFHIWDLYRPKRLAVYEPTLIICDPPFNKVRMDQLFAAIRELTPYRAVNTVKLLIAIDPAHAGALTGTFAMYGPRPTGFFPSYVTVSPAVGIEFYSNLSDEELLPLKAS